MSSSEASSEAAAATATSEGGSAENTRTSLAHSRSYSTRGKMRRKQNRKWATVDRARRRAPATTDDEDSDRLNRTIPVGDRSLPLPAAPKAILMSSSGSSEGGSASGSASSSGSAPKLKKSKKAESGSSEISISGEIVEARVDKDELQIDTHEWPHWAVRKVPRYHSAPVTCLCLLSEEWLISGDQAGLALFWRLKKAGANTVGRLYFPAPLHTIGYTNGVISFATTSGVCQFSLDSLEKIDEWSYKKEGAPTRAGAEEHVQADKHTEAALDKAAAPEYHESLRKNMIFDAEEVLTAFCVADAKTVMAAINPPVTMLHKFKGHTDLLNDLIVSEGVLFTASDDRTARAWHIESGKLLTKFRGHTDGINCLTTEPGLLCTGAADGCTRVWDTRSGEILAEFRGLAAAITCVTVDQVHDVVYTGDGQGQMTIYRARSGKFEGQFIAHDAAIVAAVVQGDQLFTACEDGVVRSWLTDDPEEENSDVYEGSGKPVTCLAVDKGLVCTGCADGIARIFDRQRAKLLHSVRVAKGGVTGLALVGDHLFASSTGCLVVCIDVDSGEIVSKISDEDDDVEFVSLACEYDTLFAGCQDGVIRRYDVDSGESVATFEGHERSVGVLIVEDGVLFSGSDDGTVRAWSVKTGGLLRVYKGHAQAITCLAVRDDLLFSGSRDGCTFSWNIQSGDVVHEFRGKVDDVRSVAMRKGIVYAAADNTVYVWDVLTSNHEPVMKLAGHRADVTCLRFNADKSILYSASDDRTVRAWNPDSGKEQAVYEGHKGAVLCVAVQEGVLYTGSADKTAIAWDTGSGERLQVYEGHTATVRNVAVDAGLLFSGSADRTVRCWNIWSGRCLRVFELLTDLRCLTVAGGILYTGSDNGTARSWNVKSIKVTKNDAQVWLVDSTVQLDSVIEVTALAFCTATSTPASVLYLGAKDGTITAWGCDEEPMRRLEFPQGARSLHPDAVFALASAYGNLFCASRDGLVRQWREVPGKELKWKAVSEHYFGSPITALTVTRLRVWATANDELLSWNWTRPEDSDGKQERAITLPTRNGARCLATLPGRAVVGTDDGTIVVCNLEKDKVAFTLGNRQGRLTFSGWGHVINFTITFLSIFLELFQLISLPLTLDLAWSDSLLGLRSALPYTLLISPPATATVLPYDILFWVAIAYTILLVVSYALHDVFVEEGYLRTAAAMEIICMGAQRGLFLPMVTVLAANANCTSAESPPLRASHVSWVTPAHQCWANEHTLRVVVGLAVSPFLLGVMWQLSLVQGVRSAIKSFPTVRGLLAPLRPRWWAAKAENAVAGLHGLSWRVGMPRWVAALDLLARTALLIAVVILLPGATAELLGCCMALALGTVLWAAGGRLHGGRKASAARVGLYWVFLWTCIAGAVADSIDDPTSDVSMIVLVAGWFAAFAVFSCLYWVWQGRGLRRLDSSARSISWSGSGSGSDALTRVARERDINLA